MQYGYIDDARRAYITPQSDTPYPWVIVSNPFSNPVEGSDIGKILQFLHNRILGI